MASQDRESFVIIHVYRDETGLTPDQRVANAENARLSEGMNIIEDDGTSYKYECQMDTNYEYNEEGEGEGEGEGEKDGDHTAPSTETKAGAGTGQRPPSGNFSRKSSVSIRSAYSSRRLSALPEEPDIITSDFESDKVYLQPEVHTMRLSEDIASMSSKRSSSRLNRVFSFGRRSSGKMESSDSGASGVPVVSGTRPAAAGGANKMSTAIEEEETEEAENNKL